MGVFEQFPYTNLHNLNLDWVLEQVRKISTGDVELQTKVSELQKKVEEHTIEIADLRELVDAIRNGEYVDLYLDSLANYIDNNLQELVGRIAKFAFFFLTDDGYFAAAIPESWDEIMFSTIYDVDDPNYGSLVLSY